MNYTQPLITDYGTLAELTASGGPAVCTDVPFGTTLPPGGTIEDITSGGPC